MFLSVAIFDEKNYSNHPKNMNHLHKDRNDLVMFIITLENM